MKQLKIQFLGDIFFIYLTLFGLILNIIDLNKAETANMILALLNLTLASYWTYDTFITWNELKKELNK